MTTNKHSSPKTPQTDKVCSSTSHFQAKNLPFTLVTKPTGAACNLDCTYCFFLSKELLYAQKQQTMTLETIEAYIRSLLNSHPDGTVTIPWQGGEPTLRGLDFFQHAVALAEKYARPNQQVFHTIQTNGTLIDAKWAKFLADNKFIVGLSMDGPAKYHDVYRVNKAGRATHAQVLRGWEFLQKAGVDTNILCTVHSANQDHPEEVYEYFRDVIGAEFIQFIPIVERVNPDFLAQAEAGWGKTSQTLNKPSILEIQIDGNANTQPSNLEIFTPQFGSKKSASSFPRLLYKQEGNAVTSRSVNPLQWGKFLSTIFDLWVKRDIGKVFVQHFDTAISALFGIYSLCVHAPKCGSALAIEFNGDVYSCDHYVEPNYLLGNIHQTRNLKELVFSKKQVAFGEEKANLPKVCQQCPVIRLCNGGCPKDRFLHGKFNSDAIGKQHDIAADEPPINYLCAGYKLFYSHILPDLQAMAALIQRGYEARILLDPQIRSQLRAKF